MGIIEDRLKQSERELAAYKRMENPEEYVISGQLARDHEAGRITKHDIQSVTDAIAGHKGK